MKFEDWEKMKPMTVGAVEHFLEAPHSHNAIVIYETEGILFVLNPFGGGTCATQELQLAEPFEITEEKVKNMMIFVKKEWKKKDERWISS